MNLDPNSVILDYVDLPSSLLSKNIRYSIGHPNCRSAMIKITCYTLSSFFVMPAILNRIKYDKNVSKSEYGIKIDSCTQAIQIDYQFLITFYGPIWSHFKRSLKILLFLCGFDPYSPLYFLIHDNFIKLVSFVLV